MLDYEELVKFVQPDMHEVGVVAGAVSPFVRRDPSLVTVGCSCSCGFSDCKDKKKCPIATDKVFWNPGNDQYLDFPATPFWSAEVINPNVNLISMLLILGLDMDCIMVIGYWAGDGRLTKPSWRAPRLPTPNLNLRNPALKLWFQDKEAFGRKVENPLEKDPKRLVVKVNRRDEEEEQREIEEKRMMLALTLEGIKRPPTANHDYYVSCPPYVGFENMTPEFKQPGDWWMNKDLVDLWSSKVLSLVFFFRFFFRR